jgi:hypothetical protein
VSLTHATLARAGIAARQARDRLIARFPQELGVGAWVFEERM